MATVREYVSKLKADADLSGFRRFKQGAKDVTKFMAKMSTNLSKKVRDLGKVNLGSSRRNNRAKTRDTIKAVRLQMRERTKAHKAEMRQMRRSHREQLKNLRNEERARRKSRAVRTRVPYIRGGANLGMGSIIGGNLIANAIQNTMRGAVGLARDFTSSIVGASAEMEKVKTEYKVLTKDLQNGTNLTAGLVTNLKRLGDTTPLQFANLSKNARILMQYGSTTKNVTDQLRMLGDVVGGDPLRLDYMAFGFAQIQQMSKLQGQELRQLINAGFNPLAEMSRHFGLSYKQMMWEMEQGNVTFDLVMDSFKRVTESGGQFFNSMKEASKTLIGRWSTFKDMIFNTSVEIGNQFLPGLKNMLEKMIDFITGAGKDMSVNLAKAILPVFDAVLNAGERVLRAFIDFDKLGQTLRDEGALKQYFMEVAAGIVEFGVELAAGVLRAKEYYTSIKEKLVEALKLMKTVIVWMLEHLPQLIKLWIAFKVIGIAAVILNLANALATLAGSLVSVIFFLGKMPFMIVGIVKSLAMFARANPLLLAATAALVAMGWAANEVFKALDQRDMLARVDELQKQIDAEDRLYKVQHAKRLALEKKFNRLKNQMSAESRKRMEADIAKAKSVELATLKRSAKLSIDQLKARGLYKDPDKAKEGGAAGALSVLADMMNTVKAVGADLLDLGKDVFSGDVKDTIKDLTTMADKSSDEFTKKARAIKTAKAIFNTTVNNDVNVDQSISDPETAADATQELFDTITNKTSEAVEAEFNKLLSESRI